MQRLSAWVGADPNRSQLRSGVHAGLRVHGQVRPAPACQGMSERGLGLVSKPHPMYSSRPLPDFSTHSGGMGRGKRCIRISRSEFPSFFAFQGIPLCVFFFKKGETRKTVLRRNIACELRKKKILQKKKLLVYSEKDIKKSLT